MKALMDKMQFGARDVLGLVALLSALWSTVALSDVEIRVGRVEARAGDEVGVPVIFHNDGTAVGFGLDLEFSEELEPDVTDCLALLDGGIKQCVSSGNGRIRALAIDMSGIADGAIGEIRFAVPSSAYNGRYFIDIDSRTLGVSDADANPVAATITVGWIDVTGGIVAEPFIGGSGGLSVSRMYDKEELIEAVDPDYVAIVSDSVDQARLAEAIGARMVAGVGPSSAVYMLAPNRRLLTLADIYVLQNSLDAQFSAGTTFVAPILGDYETWGWLAANSAIVAAFHRSMDAEDVNRVLNRLGMDATVEQLGISWRYFIIEPEVSTGLDVQALANGLALAPETRFAEPNYLSVGEGGGTEPAPLLGDGFESRGTEIVR